MAQFYNSCKYISNALNEKHSFFMHLQFTQLLITTNFPAFQYTIKCLIFTLIYFPEVRIENN